MDITLKEIVGITQDGKVAFAKLTNGSMFCVCCDGRKFGINDSWHLIFWRSYNPLYMVSENIPNEYKILIKRKFIEYRKSDRFEEEVKRCSGKTDNESVKELKELILKDTDKNEFDQEQLKKSLKLVKTAILGK